MIDEITRRGMPRWLIERRLAQAGLGILRALRGSKMTIEDAERDLFNIDTYRAARWRRLDPPLIEFLECGLELDDVATLAPGGLEESYATMEKNLLRLSSKSLGRASRRKK